jgi:hypothetical protein
VSPNGWLLNRRGRSLPANVSGVDTHRDSISSRFDCRSAVLSSAESYAEQPCDFEGFISLLALVAARVPALAHLRSAGDCLRHPEIDRRHTARSSGRPPSPLIIGPAEELVAARERAEERLGVSEEAEARARERLAAARSARVQARKELAQAEAAERSHDLNGQEGVGQAGTPAAVSSVS